MKPIKCPHCGRIKSRGRKILFTDKTLARHIKDCHSKNNEEHDYALDMADLIAGDESDGVYWGIAHELGYFG